MSPLSSGSSPHRLGHSQSSNPLQNRPEQLLGHGYLRHLEDHEPGVLPRWLHEQGATIIIAGGMGMRVQQLFAQNGITVIVGAPAGEPDQLVSKYLSGTLETGDNVCNH